MNSLKNSQKNLAPLVHFVLHSLAEAALSTHQKTHALAAMRWPQHYQQGLCAGCHALPKSPMGRMLGAPSRGADTIAHWPTDLGADHHTQAASVLHLSAKFVWSVLGQ